MCGVLLAYLTYFRPETLTFAVGSSQRRWRLFAVGLALVLPMIYFRMTSPGSMMIMNTLGITMLYLGYACILMACVNAVAADGSPGKIFQSLPARLIAIIGFYSYPIYLWHINQGRNRVIHMLYVGKFAHMGASERWLVAVSLYMVIGIAFGIVFSRLLEMPTLALRERFFPGRIRT
jgi:peptidoglycan/LPS O-acetylase OafA/YrhL